VAGGRDAAARRVDAAGRQSECAAGVAGRRDWATGLLSGSAAPTIRARHCRAKIGGAVDPATSPVSSPGRRHVILPPRYHA